jgi:hypothetical protein
MHQIIIRRPRLADGVVRENELPRRRRLTSPEPPEAHRLSVRAPVGECNDLSRMLAARSQATQRAAKSGSYAVTLAVLCVARCPVRAGSTSITNLDAASVRIFRSSRRKAMPVAVR